MSIVDFLKARIAEDEELAKSILDSGDWRAQRLTLNWSVASSKFGHLATTGYEGNRESRPIADHIATWQPNRVLAECGAKRAIMAEHEWQYADPYESWKDDAYRERWGDTRGNRHCKRCGGTEIRAGYGEMAVRVSWPCPTIKALAAVYSDHPDCQEDWA